MSRCSHEGTVEQVQMPANTRTGAEARTLWHCTQCEMVWPADPRQLAAQHDGLAEEIMAGIEGDTSRQNPDYPVDDASGDAVAILTAVVNEGQDPKALDEALKHALDQTDHTALVEAMGRLAETLVQWISAGTGQTPAKIVQTVALAVAQSTGSTEKDS